MLYLKASNSSARPDFPDKTWDIVAPAREVKDLSGPLNIPPDAITVMRVKTGNYTLNASINTLVMANRLIVTFHGARRTEKDEVKNSSPMFIRRDWHDLYQAPILSISDPMTEQAWGAGLPRIANYSGTFDDNLVPETNALIDKVCDELGISRDNVVMYGASSGGTSALLTGAQRNAKTSVIAVCAFLRPEKYREQVVAVAARAMGGTLADWHHLLADEPDRINPITAIRTALKTKPDFRCVVAQNVQDVAGINKQFPALWRKYDIDPEGGVDPSGHIMAVLYDSEEGHGQEPDSLAIPLLQMALAHFDGPVKPPVAEVSTAPRKGKKMAAAGDAE